MTLLEEYYNKFNEEKRLNSRHGQIEFITSMKYIHRCLDRLKQSDGNAYGNRILDIGAGTGRYSIPLAQEGYDVSAIELVKHNLSRLQQKGPMVNAWQGNALNLKKCRDNSYDLTLLFGPMYHLHGFEEKLQALKEAIRVTRPGGYILVAYIMNEYSVLTHAFKDRCLKESLEKGLLDENFHVLDAEDSLYSFVRLEDIDRLNEEAGIYREQIIAADGPANYMRREVNALDQEEFDAFLRYHLCTCERAELLGASGHLVDILKKQK